MDVGRILENVQQIFPAEAPQPDGLARGMRLYSYQKQSLAFCLQLERGTDKGLQGTRDVHGHRMLLRGGFLADEMGLGKTMVCTSLILANPSHAHASREAYSKRFEADAPVCKYKATLVVCPPTLVQQWQDEIRQHAPSLVVAVHYSSPEEAKDAHERYSITLSLPAAPAARVREVVARRSEEDQRMGISDGSDHESRSAARILRSLLKIMLPFSLRALQDGTVVVDDRISRASNYGGDAASLWLQWRQNKKSDDEDAEESHGEDAEERYERYAACFHQRYGHLVEAEAHGPRPIEKNDVLLGINGEPCIDEDDALEMLSKLGGTDITLQMRSRNRIVKAATGGRGAAAKKRGAKATAGDVDNRSADECSDMRRCDVLITTPHWLTKSKFDGRQLRSMWFHRLIVDESHLLGRGGSAVLPIEPLLAVRATYVWCVSGTPMSTDLQSDLTPQAVLLGQPSLIDRLTRLRDERQVADTLRSLMIRHTKSQRLDDGSLALVLRKADVKIEWLGMTAHETELHAQAVCRHSMHEALSTSQSLRDVGRAVLPLRFALALRGRSAEDAAARRVSSDAKLEPYDYAQLAKTTKNRWLVKELLHLGEQQACTHILVFTHHAEVQQALVQQLQIALPPDAWTISSFSNATRAIERHNIIKQFQQGGEGDDGDGVTQARAVAEAAASSSKAAGKRPVGRGGKGTAAAAAAAAASGSGRPKCHVLVATFDVASVGITLTRAQRVYMMEPTTDPATAAQAAGRVHRLGQKSDVSIVQLAYSNTLDAALLEMHDAVRDGALSLRSSNARGSNAHRFSASQAHSILTKWGCGIKHDWHHETLHSTDIFGNNVSQRVMKCDACGAVRPVAHAMGVHSFKPS